MKFFLLAICAAVLCATVTKATSSPFGFDLEDKISDAWLDLKCVREVLLEESSSEVKALWGEYKGELRKLYSVEWTKCKGISNIAEQQKCKSVVLEKSLELYSEYLSKYIKIANWGKALGGLKKIATKCVKLDAFDELESNDDEDLVLQQFLAKAGFGLEDRTRSVLLSLKCTREVLLEESSSEVKALWGEYKGKLHSLHTVEWTKCKGISNIVEQQKCKSAVIEKSFELYSEYLAKYIKIANWEKALGGIKKIATKCVKLENLNQLE